MSRAMQAETTQHVLARVERRLRGSIEVLEELRRDGPEGEHLTQQERDRRISEIELKRDELSTARRALHEDLIRRAGAKPFARHALGDFNWSMQDALCDKEMAVRLG